ncbi:MAG: response regulator [Bacteroidia bacterium]|nr:response regulator [Bacteroidia bacterium]
MKQLNSKYDSVMIIDDDEIETFIDERLIKGYNFAKNVYVYNSPKNALDKLKNLSFGNSIIPDEKIPKYLFIDLNIPISDGLDFWEEYESLPESLKNEIEIIMLTSALKPNDFGKWKRFDRINKYVQKPLSEKILLQL